MDTVSIPGMSGTLLQALHLVFGFGSYSEAMAPYACHIYIYNYVYMMMMKCGTNHSHGLQSLCECWHRNYGMHDLKICSLQLATRSFYTSLVDFSHFDWPAWPFAATKKNPMCFHHESIVQEATGIHWGCQVMTLTWRTNIARQRCHNSVGNN